MDKMKRFVELLVLAACLSAWMAAGQELLRLDSVGISPNQLDALLTAPLAAEMSKDADCTLMSNGGGRTKLVVVNPRTRANVVFDCPVASTGTKVRMTRLLMAELRNSGLGDADAYTCIVAEKKGEGYLPLEKTEAKVPPACRLPQFRYGTRGKLGLASAVERKLRSVSLEVPTPVFADGVSDDDRNRAFEELKRTAAACGSYRYEYVLPNGDLTTFCDVGFDAVEVDGREASVVDKVAVEVGNFRMVDWSDETTVPATSVQLAPIAAGAQTWDAALVIVQPILVKVGFSSLGTTMIGASYQPETYTKDGIQYPAALIDQIMGNDMHPSSGCDIRIQYNRNFSFYYGTDGNCPSTQLDLRTIATHELCHGLGFSSSHYRGAGGIRPDGSWLRGAPSIFDVFLYCGNGRLVDLSQTDRAAAFTSEALYWDGDNAKAANGGDQVKMFAPSIYKSGSSVCHWDTYVTFKTFMKYAARNGEVCHEIDTRLLGTFKDMGWGMRDDPEGGLRPLNDNFAAATSIFGLVGTATGSNEGATNQTGEPLSSFVPDATTTVWWIWTAPETGNVQIDTVGSEFDTVLGVYTGLSVTSLSTVAQDDDGGGEGASKCSFACVAGTTYRICVAGHAGATGIVKLNWTLSDVQYSVAYHAGAYGSGVSESATKMAGQPLTLLDATFTRTGFTQTGWSRNMYGLTMDYELGALYTIDEAVTLYPYWTENPPMDVKVALDNMDFQFTIGGDASWFGQDTVTHDGVDALRSGAIAGNQSSWLQTRVTGPGEISFWWYASSEGGNWDYLAFSIDGVQTNAIGGTSCSWAQCSYRVPSGSHVLRWTYRKDDSQVLGLDAGFVDQVVWTPAPTYAVTYAPGVYGTELPRTATKTQGEALPLSGAIFTRTGYTQTGWSKSESGNSMDYALNVLYTDDAELTLYPCWTANAYSVAYALDGGTHGSAHPAEVGFDAEFQVSAPIRSGYTFVGWTVSDGLEPTTAKWGTSNGASTAITDSSTLCVNGAAGNVWFKGLTPTANGNVTLTANWRENPAIDAATALDNPEMLISAGGDAGWFGQTETTHDGVDAMQSGPISDNQCSWLQTYVIGPGEISFWWYASSEGGDWDCLAFSIDGVQTNKIGGANCSWTQCSYVLPSGTHELKWTYRKDENMSSGLDAGFLDQIVWTPLAEPPPEDPVVDPTPVDPTPAEPTPIDPTPVEPAPVEPTPIEPTPIEPTPVEPTPIELPVLYSVDATGGDGTAAMPYATAATVYDGYIRDADGNVKGTVQVTVAKGKVDKRTGEFSAKVKATVQMADGTKKISFKGGVADQFGHVTGLTAAGHRLEVALGTGALGGTLDGALVDGARNIFSAKDAAAKALVSVAERAWVGAIGVADETMALSVVVAKKGKVKISGTVGGVKVGVKSQLLVGDGVCCIPVVVVKKASLAFNLWLMSDGSVEVVGHDGVSAGKAGVLAPGAKFKLGGGESVLSGMLEEYLPNGLAVTVNGGKWVVAGGAKAGKLKLARNLGMIDQERSKFTDNMSGLKLSCKVKDGTFKGTFKAYALESGKLKSYTVNVSGVMVGDVGRGTASIKKPSVSWPVTIGR